jgi:hypothetical protein
MKRSLIASCIFIYALSASAHPQLMRQQAREAIQLPAKVDILPIAQVNQTTKPVAVQIVLRTSVGQPIAAQEATTVEVTATQPSGKVVSTSVIFAPGESTKTTELSIPETGVSKLRARQENDRLLESTNYVNVTPDQNQSAAPGQKLMMKKRHSKKTSQVLHHPTGFSLRFDSGVHPRLLRAALYQQPNEPAAFPPSTGPQLMLKVSGENDAAGVRADGVAFARVQVFYMADTPPQADIKVWVSQSNGDISANPIIIPQGQFMGESHWTSKYPIPSAKLTVAGTNPHTPFAGDTVATVAFGAPILGIGLLNPPTKMSIVDSVTLTAVFFDADGNPVSTGTKRSYRFVSNSPVLRLQPDHADVAAGDADFSTIAFPTFVGESQVQVESPGYISKPQRVKVTGSIVLLLCVVGGVLGGLLTYINNQGKLWARIVTGIIVGAVASWAYVFVGLPTLQSAILHTQISVLFVSVLAAFAGVKTLSVITKAFNLGF